MKKIVAAGVTFFVWYSISTSADAKQDSLKAVPTNNSSSTTSIADAPETPGTVITTEQINTAASVPSDSAAVKFAKVRFLSQPDSATVVVDSIEKGRTPVTLDSLTPGPHTIYIKKKGYFQKKISTTLSPDTVQEINAVLVKPGCIIVTSVPPGATVFLNDKEWGVTPYENAKLKPGSYTLRLELKQRATVERTVVIKEDVCDTLTSDLPLIKSDSAAKKGWFGQKPLPKKTVDMIVIGIFLVFGIVIFAVEAGNAK